MRQDNKGHKINAEADEYVSTHLVQSFEVRWVDITPHERINLVGYLHTEPPSRVWSLKTGLKQLAIPFRALLATPQLTDCTLDTNSSTSDADGPRLDDILQRAANRLVRVRVGR
jgi:hypothetical protein